MRRPLLIVVLCAIGSVGCTSRTTISLAGHADSARVPVYFSHSVVDGQGKQIPPAGLERRGSFSAQNEACEGADNRWDLSKDINDQVAAVHGEAIVDFAVASRLNDGRKCLSNTATGVIVSVRSAGVRP